MIDFQFECVELDAKTPTSSFGRFVFKPLDLGDGITLGNTLRRVLLSGLSGLRISGLRIAGINNEFASIDGVREDVLEIILNLKEIVFRSKVPESTYARFRIQGPAIITANSLQLSKHIEIVNPFTHILTISDNSVVEFEVKLEWGRSYALAEEQSYDGPSDYIPIDANFMPVQKMNYFIHPISSKDQTKIQKEQLFLDIWTNGAITPEEAVFDATNLIINWVLSIKAAQLRQNETTIEDERKQFGNESKNDITQLSEDSSEIESETDTSKVEKIPIEKLNLSTRSYKSLKSANINFIEDLQESSIKELKRIRNLGRKSLEEIIQKLAIMYKITLK